METSIARSFYEVFFSIFPFPFFLQLLEVWAAFNNAFYGLFGINTNFIAF